jgi:hypothetical protein
MNRSGRARSNAAMPRNIMIAPTIPNTMAINPSGELSSSGGMVKAHSTFKQGPAAWFPSF